MLLVFGSSVNPHTVWIPLSADAEVIQITVAVDNDYPLHHIVEMQLITFSDICLYCAATKTDSENLGHTARPTFILGLSFLLNHLDLDSLSSSLFN